MATYRQKVLAYAKELGAIIHEERDPFEVRAEAPDGFHWAREGLHEFIASRWDGDDCPTSEYWKDLWERMQGGLEACSDDNENCQMWYGFIK